MKLNLRTKLIGSFVIILLLMVVVGLTGTHTSKTIRDRLDKIIEQDIIPANILGAVGRRADFVRANSLLHLLTRSIDDMNRYESEVADWVGKINTDLDTLENIFEDQATLDKLAEFRTAWETYLRIWREQVVPLSRENRDEEAFALARKGGIGGAAARGAMYKLDELHNVNVAAANHRLKLANQDSMKSQYILLAVFLFAIVLGLAFGIRRSSLIAGPMNSVSKAARLVAAGDFDQIVEAKTGDEIESMANAFNSVTVKLKTMVEELRHEINERQKAEDQIRESKQWLSTTLRSIGDAVIATDAKGLVSFMNPVAEDLTGWDEAETVGRPLKDVFKIINEQTGERSENPVDRVLREGVIVGLADHTALIAKDGTKRSISDSGAPIRDEQGNIIGAVMVFRDISERKQTEEGLRQYREHLEDMVEERTAELKKSNIQLQQEIEERKQMNEVLRESEERFRNAFENSAIGMALVSKDGKWVKVNRALCNIVGYSEEELLLKTFQEITHPDDLNIDLAYVHRMLSKEIRYYDMEKRYFHKDGHIVWILLNVSMVYGATDEPPYFISQIQDITGRRRAEEELRLAQHKTQLILDSAGEGIYGVDIEGKVTFINPEATRLLGYEKGELLGQLQHAVIHHTRSDGTPYPQEECPIYLAFRDGTIQSVSSEVFWRKDGSSFLVEYTSTPIIESDTRPVGAVVVFRDITKRKQAEEELKKYKDHLEERIKESTEQLSQALRNAEEMTTRISTILTSVADGLVVTDHKARVVMMNPAAEALLGLRFSEIIGQPLNLAIEDQTLRDRIRVALEERESGYEFDFEIPGDQPDRPRILRAKTAKIETETKHNDTMVMVISDVTIEREIDRMKTEFLSTAAHELRTPLTSIQGFSEILLIRNNLKPERRQKYLSYINAQAVSLGKIIGDLLDISRIESGKGFNLHKEAFDLGKSIKEIVELFRSRSPSHGFETNVPEGPLTAFADQGKLQQLMENLLSNAVKYSPAGGTIRITAQKSEECEREQAGESISQPSTILISVEDEGIGMTPDQVKQVFDKFWRADASNKAIEGTGLGMSIVKYIVEAHGGTVQVESEPGKGTTITIEMPGD